MTTIIKSQRENTDMDAQAQNQTQCHLCDETIPADGSLLCADCYFGGQAAVLSLPVKADAERGYVKNSVRSFSI